MNAPRRSALVLLLAAAAAAGGCALTNKGDPISPRYFSPAEPPPVEPPERADDLRLRLSRVRAGTHHKERIVFRDSAHEVGFHEELRWAELPETYLRRALERALFERRGIGRVTGGSAAMLEVELVDFAELRGDEPRVRVRVAALLHTRGRALWQQSITAEQPLSEDAEDSPDLLAEAMGRALSDAVEQLAERVVASLEAERSE